MQKCLHKNKCVHMITIKERSFTTTQAHSLLNEQHVSHEDKTTHVKPEYT